jgi:hypothetical protein
MSTTTAPHPHGRHGTRWPTDSNQLPVSLGRYTEDRSGLAREIIRLAGASGSTLVVDRLASTHSDPRLVAHLAPDEPPANARIVCSMYLADPSKGKCRPLRAEDLEIVPFTGSAPTSAKAPPDTQVLDRDGVTYCIRKVATGRSLPELRWTRSRDVSQGEPCERVTIRDVVAHLQDYEPVRSITINALAIYERDPCVSTSRLSADLERLLTSAIVLNRGLREVVQRRVARGDFSMSQIAMCCGRTKRDDHGNLSGETSWLARRIGQLPEGGEAEPSPWVHSDVLALIAREGLGGSPHEMELG